MKIVGLKFSNRNYEIEILNVKNGKTEKITSSTIVFAAGAYTSILLNMLDIKIPIFPVRGTMWATKPQNEKLISTVMLSGESYEYWDRYNSNFTVTHQSMNGEGITRTNLEINIDFCSKFLLTPFFEGRDKIFQKYLKFGAYFEA